MIRDPVVSFQSFKSVFEATDLGVDGLQGDLIIGSVSNLVFRVGEFFSKKTSELQRLHPTWMSRTGS